MTGPNEENEHNNTVQPGGAYLTCQLGRELLAAVAAAALQATNIDKQEWEKQVEKRNQRMISVMQ